jgi:short chain dehydrogenase
MAPPLPCAFSFLPPTVPFLLQTYVFKVQNFREKYNARWALVTGGSSGIGRAITERLASQGLNVVVAALPDSLLDQVVESMSEKYPSQEFRAIGVDLSSASFMDEIVDLTDDVDVQIVFNNAGFLTMGVRVVVCWCWCVVVCVCVCMFARVCVYVCSRVRVFVCVCVYVGVSV